MKVELIEFSPKNKDVYYDYRQSCKAGKVFREIITFDGITHLNEGIISWDDVIPLEDFHLEGMEIQTVKFHNVNIMKHKNHEYWCTVSYPKITLKAIV